MSYNAPNSLLFKRFGKLEVIGFAGRRNKKIRWTCLCDCGNITSINHYRLIGGATSCGCLLKETLRRAHTVHGQYDHPLYLTWINMRLRCTSKNHYGYNASGGIGAKVCDEWTNDFCTFIAWAESAGYKSGLELRRIDDTGDYTPENCVWLAHKEAERSESRILRVIINGQNKPLSQWSEETGIDYSTIYNRLKKGWSSDRLLDPPNGIPYNNTHVYWINEWIPIEKYCEDHNIPEDILRLKLAKKGDIEELDFIKSW